MKVLVIGGNPAGMSAASRVKRKAPDTEVTVLEKTQEVSYGACGLPYYVAGLNDDLDMIRIRKPDEFRKSGIDVRLGREVVAVDFNSHTVKAINSENDNSEEEYTYDKLVLAMGSSPRIPKMEGVELEGISALKTLQDAEFIKTKITSGIKNVVIVGGGAIGLEIAEACLLQKVENIHIVEFMDSLAGIFDKEFSDEAEKVFVNHGVNVHLSEGVQKFEGEDGHVTKVITDKGSYDADLVIMSIGVVPNTSFLDGIDKLRNGALITDESMQTSVKDVYAAGDCATVLSALTGEPMFMALGTNANKQGRLVGDSVLGKPVSFKRALGTSMLRCVDLEFAKTGFSEKDAQNRGLNYKTTTVQARSHARYYPDPYTVTIKLVYDAETHVILGAQVMGEKEAAWRIDVFACAIDQKMTTEELGYLDLGYAPMFAGVWDAVQIAANASK